MECFTIGCSGESTDLDVVVQFIQIRPINPSPIPNNSDRPCNCRDLFAFFLAAEFFGIAEGFHAARWIEMSGHRPRIGILNEGARRHLAAGPVRLAARGL